VKLNIKKLVGFQWSTTDYNREYFTWGWREGTRET